MFKKLMDLKRRRGGTWAVWAYGNFYVCEYENRRMCVPFCRITKKSRLLEVAIKRCVEEAENATWTRKIK